MARILIVDDDVVNAQLYANKLQSEGHDVVFLTDGIKAQEKSKEKYDLILLDVMMPGVDGITLLQSFKSGVNSKTPVIMFTNLVSDETKEESKKHGADELLFKADTTPNELIAKIHGYVGDAPAPKKDTASGDSKDSSEDEKDSEQSSVTESTSDQDAKEESAADLLKEAAG